MDSKYLKLSKLKFPIWIWLPALIIWAATLTAGYLEDHDIEEETWSALQVAEVTLSIGRATDDWPAWLRWLADVDSEAEALKWLTQNMSKLAETDRLNNEGLVEFEAISALHENDLEMFQDWSDAEWREKYEFEGLWAWERSAFEQIYSDRKPSWYAEESGFYLEEEQYLASFALLGSLVWWGAFLIGLPFIPVAFRTFLSRNHEPISFLSKSLRPSRVVTIYVLVDVAAAFALGHFPLTGALVDEHGAAVGVDFQVAPVQVLLLLTGLWGN